MKEDLLVHLFCQNTLKLEGNTSVSNKQGMHLLSVKAEYIGLKTQGNTSALSQKQIYLFEVQRECICFKSEGNASV